MRIQSGLALLALLACQTVLATEPTTAKADWKTGDVKLDSVSSIAFAPDGVLLIGDSMGAAVYAVQTKEKAAAKINDVNFTGIQEKAAAMLGVQSSDLQIADMAVSPSGAVYFAAVRGSGSQSTPVIFKLADGKLSDVSLNNVSYMKAALPNAVESQETGRGNPRATAITDLTYLDGRVYVAGLSNEEFSSNLRSIPFPFTEFNAGSSVEIFHGAHGRLETNSPVRTFAAFDIDGEPHLLAAYTCTPLVKIPVAQLEPGKHIKGVTIAELGNRNRPLDMVVYAKDGKRFVLMANSARGVMKIRTDGIDAIEAITERVGGGGTAGLGYETIEDLKGVMELDRLDETRALVMIVNEAGESSLKTIALP